MKRFTFILAAALISSGLFAQSKSIKKFQEKYQNDRDATTVTIDGKLLDLAGSIAAFAEDDEEAQAFARIAQNIEFLNILSVPLYGSGLSHEEIADLRKQLKRESYDDLMQVRDGSQKINFLADAGEDKLRNMVVLIEDKDEFVMMSINGILNMKDLSTLVKDRNHWNKED